MKKGQFFVIGAVVITIALFTVYECLTQDWIINLPEMQGSNIIWMEKEVENSLKDVVLTSSNVEDDLNVVIEQQKKLLWTQEIQLDVDYKKLPLGGYGFNITLERENEYIKKQYSVN